MTKINFHEISDIFPILEKPELDEVAADIRANGLLSPIVLYEGKILDGRNRYLACQLAGVAPRFEQFNDGDPLAFVISVNLKRRHLTREQRDEVIRKLRAQGMTLRKIADTMKVSADTAHRVTGDMELSEIGKLTGADGKKYPAHYAPRKTEFTEDKTEPLHIAAFDEHGSQESFVVGPDEELRVVKTDKPHVAYNAGGGEWYTPKEYIRRAVAVMGAIDLDPASTEVANKVVGAAQFYTAEDDGLKKELSKREWINPSICTCGIYPLVIEWSHEDKDMLKMLEDLSAHAGLFSRKSSERKVVFRLVQGLPSGIRTGTPAQTPSRSHRKAKSPGRKTPLQSEQKRAGMEEDSVRDRQSQAAPAQNSRLVLLDTGSVGTLSAGMELPLRLLWRGGDLTSGSLYSAFTSRLPRDSTRKYGPCVLEVQLGKGQSAPRGMDSGQASICPHCGAVGFSVAKPSNVYCNPPYATGLIEAFADKLLFEYSTSHVSQAIVLVNNATETKWFQALAWKASAICFPLGRIKFWNPEKESFPLQGQAVLYIGRNAGKFVKHFSDLGTTWKR